MKRKSTPLSKGHDHEKAKDSVSEERDRIEQKGFRFIEESFHHKVQEIVRGELEKLLKPKDFMTMYDEWVRLHIAFRARLKRATIVKTLENISDAVAKSVAKEQAKVVSVSFADVVEQEIQRRTDALKKAQEAAIEAAVLKIAMKAEDDDATIDEIFDELDKVPGWGDADLDLDQLLEENDDDDQI